MANPAVLSDLVVIDLSRALAGPHAAMMLGDLGARVIKVEIPEGGDDTRGWGPPFVGGNGSDSTYFMSCNRNKESVTADLKTAAGRTLLTRLLRHADVVCENFRTGVLDRLGFSVDRLHQINPRLVILSITGFGHDGPEAGRAGYDQILQGEAGLMSLTGENATPTKVGVPIGDVLAGMYGAFGVLAALHERASTNRGRVVRTSLLAAIVGALAFQGTRYTIGGELPGPSGNRHSAIAPYGSYRTAEATVQVAVGSESLWRQFAEALAIDPDQPEFVTNALRVDNHDALARVIEDVLSNGTTDEWLDRLRAAGVPAGKVRSLDEVFSWQQTQSQGLIIEVERADIGRIKLPGPPLRFEGQGGQRVTHRPPPRLGEHNATVTAWLDSLEGTQDRAAVVTP